MRRIWVLLSLSCMLLGCKKLEWRKYSSEDIFQEEVNRMDWEKVDSYPSFASCEQLETEEEKETCFKKELTERILKSLERHTYRTQDKFREEIRLTITVPAEGKARLDTLAITDELESKLPYLKAWIVRAVNGLPTIYPAEKRGIPVTTTFELPLLIESD